MEDVYYACWRCEGGGGLHDGLSDSLDSWVRFVQVHEIVLNHQNCDSDLG